MEKLDRENKWREDQVYLRREERQKELLTLSQSPGADGDNGTHACVWLFVTVDGLHNPVLASASKANNTQAGIELRIFLEQEIK